MSVVVATALDEALAALEHDPAASVVAGGTDFMVEVNFGHRHPASVVSVDRVEELRRSSRDDGHLVLGAGVTYAEMMRPELASAVPALAVAARTVGSPPIRNAGTVGGNLGTASPAGDTLPVLSALDAEVELRSARGSRTMSVHDFVVGPKRNALEPGELIRSVRIPVLRGRQEYLKVGTRNAMVISVAGLALAVDEEGRTVRCALGSVGPVPIRARDAEAWVAGEIDWDAGTAGDEVCRRFGELVARTARPIDDHRSTADYRRHAVGVLARRALARAFPGGAAT